MTERAYVQPQVIIGTLRYLNPNSEDISTNKTLIKTDSPIQKLNPGNTDLNVYLADSLLCEGLIVYIFNDSPGSGNLNIYFHDTITFISTIAAKSMSQFVCIDNMWHPFSMGISSGDYYTKDEIDTLLANLSYEGENPSTNPSAYYTKDEIDSLFDNLVYGIGTTGVNVPRGNLEFYTEYEIDYMFQNIQYGGGTSAPPTAGPDTWYDKTEIDSMFANLTYI